MSQKKRKKRWMKFRHRIVRNIAYLILYPFSRIKFGVTVEKFKEQNGRQYLIVLNHQTTFDQFFVGMSFKGPVYYLATEDIFSNGWISNLIRFVIAPIPIRKQTTDVQAVMNCIRVAKEGGTIALAPEGNRTYSGKTEYMNPAIAPLIKKLKLPLAIYRIEGGYGIQPRWSDVIRKGKMRAYVSRVIEPDEYLSMTDDALYDLVKNELYVNEGSLGGTYIHKKSAEYLERAIYVCPYCGLSHFESHGDIVECKKCNRKVRYLPTKELKGIGFEFPFNFVNDWYSYQYDFINNLDTRAYESSAIYCDVANVSEVIVYKHKLPLYENAAIALYGNKITVKSTLSEELVFPFEGISAVTVLGRNKLNIYYNGRIWQLKSDKRFNALKYVNIFYRHKNIMGGNENGKFLGL